MIGQESQVKSPFSWNGTGKCLSAMVGTGLTFFIINFLIESKRLTRTRFVRHRYSINCLQVHFWLHQRALAGSNDQNKYFFIGDIVSFCRKCLEALIQRMKMLVMSESGFLEGSPIMTYFEWKT